MTKSVGNYRFGHIYWRNIYWKIHFLCRTEYFVSLILGSKAKLLLEVLWKEGDSIKDFTSKNIKVNEPPYIPPNSKFKTEPSSGGKARQTKFVISAEGFTDIDTFKILFLYKRWDKRWKVDIDGIQTRHEYNTEVHSEACQRFTTNTPRVFHVETTWKQSFLRCFNVEYMWCFFTVFARVVNGIQPFIIFSKSSILDVWQSLEIFNYSRQK